MLRESIGCEGKDIQILYDILHHSRDTREYRSKLSSIFPLACVKTNHVKKYGLRPIFVDFIIGKKELENPDIYINNLGKVKGR